MVGSIVLFWSTLHNLQSLCISVNWNCIPWSVGILVTQGSRRSVHLMSLLLWMQFHLVELELLTIEWNGQWWPRSSGSLWMTMVASLPSLSRPLAGVVLHITSFCQLCRRSIHVFGCLKNLAAGDSVSHITSHARPVPFQSHSADCPFYPRMNLAVSLPCHSLPDVGDVNHHFFSPAICDNADL